MPNMGIDTPRRNAMRARHPGGAGCALRHGAHGREMGEATHQGPACALCGRPTRLTRHHLIPRRLHRQARFRRRFGGEALRTRVLMLCSPCHRHVHAVLPERTLGEHYHSREALLTHPEIARFVSWLAARPAELSPRVRRPRRR